MAATFGANSLRAQSSWTELAPTGTPPVARTGASAVYDSATDRMIVFGGRDGSGNNHSDVWVLTHANGEGATGKWIRLIANNQAGSPPARSGHSAVYDSANNRMIIFGGCSANCAPVFNDVWVLANANGVGGAPAWTQLSPTGTPPPGRAYAVVGLLTGYNQTSSNTLYLLGGQDGGADPCSALSDMWSLSNANGLDPTPPAWSNFTPPVGFPPGLATTGAAVTSVQGKLYWFGGMSPVNGVCTETNSVWQMITSGGIPIILGYGPVTASSPSPRTFASAAYDSKGSRLLIFGGVDASNNYLNDLWSFSEVATWSELTLSGSLPVTREGQTAVIDSDHQRMTVFGGSNASGVLDDAWVMHAPYLPGMACVGTAGNPLIVSSSGVAERVGDFVLRCTGGTPTPQGQPIPEYGITLTFNTNVTGRLFPEAAGLSEAVAEINEAFPANPVPSNVLPVPGAPPQILCNPVGSVCSETGTGGSPNPYQTQPNVFAGKQSNATTLYWKIPIDPPPANNTRVVRFTNVRVNASQLGRPSGLIPLQSTLTLALSGTKPPLFNAGPYTVGLSEVDLVPAVQEGNPLAQCQPHNAALLGGSGTAAFDFSVLASEGFGATFKYRNYGTFLSGPAFPPVLDEQNVFGWSYNTETGFYSPSLFTPVPTIGLADFGTRILVSFGPISSGTRLFVPTTITMTGNYPGSPGQLQLVQANANGNSTAGYVPVASTAMIGTTPVAAAVSSGSTAYAVYEVINADPNTIETATIPVAVAFTMSPALGTVNATTSLAPLSTVTMPSQTAPIPRFTNFSSAQAAYSIAACAGVKQ